MTKPQKHSVALVISEPGNDARLLAVLRPEDDDELPGVWGLPATSVRGGETPAEAALRVGRQKLGVELLLKGLVAVGEQERPAYTLTMTLFQAQLVRGQPSLPSDCDEPGVTFYASWRWANPQVLQEGALRGSLCCQLCLQHHQVRAPQR